jgi:hypothetical protein
MEPMYKRAARVYQRLKAQRVIGKRAIRSKAHGVISLPGLDNGNPHLPNSNAARDAAKKKKTAKKNVAKNSNLGQQHLEPKRSSKTPIASPHFLDPNHDLQVAHGLVAAFKGATILSMGELLRKLPILRPTEDEIQLALLAFSGRGYVTITECNELVSLDLRKLNKRISTLEEKIASADRFEKRGHRRRRQ